MEIEGNDSEHNQGLNWGLLYKKYGWKFFLIAILMATIAVYFAFFK